MPSLTSKKKDLYLGKCLDDLHKLSEVKQLGNNVTIIAKSADKVFRDAEGLDVQGDEERAFVMFFKYFNIIKQIKSKADYKKQKDYYDNLLGKKNQLKAIERLEKLTDSLKERYDLKEAEAVAKKLELLEAKESSSRKKDSPHHETSSSNNVTDTKEAVPPPGQITCSALCAMLRDKNTDLILMDVRPATDFAQSHISHTKCINVSEEAILPGSTVNHIQAKVSSESQEVWTQRRHADHIILLDWKSTLDAVTVGTPLKTLKDALFKFDLTTIIKSEPLVLDGGYEQWLLLYPTLTTNAHVARPSDNLQPKASSPTITLDFDYPDLDDSLKKKTANPPAQPSVTPADLNSFTSDGAPQISANLFPSFDRSLKPTATPGNISQSLPPANSSQEKFQNNVITNNTQSDIESTLYPAINNNTVPNNLRPDKNVNVFNDSKTVEPTVRNDLASDLNESVVNRQKKRNRASKLSSVSGHQAQGRQA